jgi:hypothetical protein
MTTVRQPVERTDGRHDVAERVVLAVAALVGIGANVALAATVVTFLYVLATLL